LYLVKNSKALNS